MTEDLPSEITAQIQANLGLISNAIQWYTADTGTRTLSRVLVGGQKERLERLVAVADKLNTSLVPLTACKNGCSHCCHQAVAISTEEARNISEYTGYAFRAVDMEFTNVNVNKFKGVACPFLHDDKCTIYPARPLACRLQFNISDDPSLCDIKSKPGESVPTLNFSKFWGTVVTALDHSNFNDIRYFFPGSYKK